jgi:hypothetical protein
LRFAPKYRVDSLLLNRERAGARRPVDERPKQR